MAKYDLLKEPEILEQHRSLPQILDADNDVENMHLAVGFASRCWVGNEAGIFDDDAARRIANELCAYIRLAREDAEAAAGFGQSTVEGAPNYHGK